MEHSPPSRNRHRHSRQEYGAPDAAAPVARSQHVASMRPGSPASSVKRDESTCGADGLRVLARRPRGGSRSVVRGRNWHEVNRPPAKPRNSPAGTTHFLCVRGGGRLFSTRPVSLLQAVKLPRPTVRYEQNDKRRGGMIVLVVVSGKKWTGQGELFITGGRD